MRRAILVAVALCYLMMGVTATLAIDGNGLFEHCLAAERFMDRRGSGEDMMRAGLCRGFVVGAMDTLIMTQNICPPDGLDGQQAIDIVKFWLRDHPEARHLAAARLVQVALKDKFPCN